MSRHWVGCFLPKLVPLYYLYGASIDFVKFPFDIYGLIIFVDSSISWEQHESHQYTFLIPYITWAMIDQTRVGSNSSSH
jgi:hypothetical protein